ncbi:MAG TPA: transporter substrate-binding domain-containing protein, partial [Candidatus Angelobacter sp.]|nr:transporter substrate-binding domain-containing protein [Candidatus Angelobacter sp.]
MPGITRFFANGLAPGEGSDHTYAVKVWATPWRWLLIPIAAVAVCSIFAGWWLNKRALDPSRVSRPFRIYPHLPPADQGVDPSLIASSNEIFLEACRRRHIPVEVVDIQDPPVPALAAGKIDLMHVVWDSPENRKKLFISEPWVVDSAWMVSLESSGINSPADVTGRRVWIQNNGRHRYLAGENFPGAIVEAQDSYLRAVEGVCLGKADAALVSPVIAGSNLAFERLPACENVKLKFTLLPKGRIWFGIGAPRNNPAAIAAAKAIRE